ncbi:VOC family protein [Streptomyces sp. N2-109]|uniref:VOC family protein n=1 Tax=Streptomyces gossypii TaxID=2883101 RepID=A0ABT2JQ04_9ACTN|nr:VOC family protein [Streptomyces gossypii]MCT2589963.1 VOC family protein [Streptomyces gossypii]
MITTDFVPGSPCWLDLGVRDARAAAAFYGAVFGWRIEPYEPAPDGFGFFQLDGRTVGALGPLSGEEARSSWMIYFSTSDADAATRAVERLGGSVRVPPMEVEGAGRLAQYTDPVGAEFAVWEAAGVRGIEAADEAGTLTWVELCTTDASAARGFYRGLFGWETKDVAMPGDSEGTYTLLTPAGVSEERMHGGMVEVPAEYLQMTGGTPYWHPVFGSDDCDATVAGVTAQRGTVSMGPEDAPGVGRLAVCADPSGAEFVVLTPAPGE